MEVGVHVLPTPLGRFVDLVHDAEMWVPIVSRDQYVSSKPMLCIVHCAQVSVSVHSPVHSWLPICSQDFMGKQMVDLTF